ncbi:MAG: hypothetical protein ACMVP2_16475 [Imperialibacter sp.]|uniref:hypothetical protein n=1 Tax=Imperialibacter sp. TaxID=2038411 RepID=UPI0030D99F1F
MSVITVNITLLLALLFSPLQEDGILLTDVEEVTIGCLNLDKLDMHYVFNSAAEFTRAMSEFRSPNLNCGKTQIAAIDFSKRTLVGVKLESGSCMTFNHSSSFHLEGQKKIICQVRFDDGNCFVLRQKILWWSIPKTAKEDVSFDVRPYEN